jgi:hypothetical protein
MHYPGMAAAAVVGMFLAILVMLEVGRRIGMRHHAKDPENAGKGLGPLEGAVLGLMGLLIAFTFSGAGSRFDARRKLIVQETNAIGTAYLRLALLPAATQPPLREYFRQYLDERLAFYQNVPHDGATLKAAKARTDALQAQIWSQAIEATRQLSGLPNANAVTSLVIQSLNDMIDIVTTRMAALQTHPPRIVYETLVALVLASALLAGYQIAAQKKRTWFHMVGFATIVALSVIIILDYEYPRVGLIRIDPVDQLLVDLRESIR